MTSEIIHTINGKKYVLIEYPIVEGKSETLRNLVKKYQCIEQGIGKVHTGWITTSYVIAKILVPEENILAFQAEG
jgi:hypothetical protein